jgi:hypothetical protein
VRAWPSGERSDTAQGMKTKRSRNAIQPTGVGSEPRPTKSTLPVKKEKALRPRRRAAAVLPGTDE